MMSYPMFFNVSAMSQSGIQPTWKSTSQHFPYETLMAIPPEFEGPGGGYSPEDIYAMALTNCFIATFKVFAEKSRLQYKNISIQTSLSVNRNDKGQPWMDKAVFNIELSGVVQKENARRILEKTSQGCMILNSVMTENIFDFNILD